MDWPIFRAINNFIFPNIVQILLRNIPKLSYDRNLYIKYPYDVNKSQKREKEDLVEFYYKIGEMVQMWYSGG